MRKMMCGFFLCLLVLLGMSGACAAGLEVDRLGVDVTNTTDPELPEGLMILAVTNPSLAEACGLQQWDIIVAVDEEPVCDVTVLRQKLQQGVNVLDIRRPEYTVSDEAVVGPIVFRSMQAKVKEASETDALNRFPFTAVVNLPSGSLQLRNDRCFTFAKIPTGAQVSVTQVGHAMNRHSPREYAYVTYQGKNGYVKQQYLREVLSEDMQELIRKFDDLAAPAAGQQKEKHTYAFRYTWSIKQNDFSFASGQDLRVDYRYGSYRWFPADPSNEIEMLNIFLHQWPASGWSKIEMGGRLFSGEDVQNFFRTNVVLNDLGEIVFQVMPVVPCEYCGGDGEVQVACSECIGRGQKGETCAACGGSNQIHCSNCSGAGVIDCGACGAIGQLRCDECRGTGRDSAGQVCGLCAGLGQINCGICQGSGMRRCLHCNGVGEKNCPDCVLGTIQTQCDLCGGQGTQTEGCQYCAR